MANEKLSVKEQYNNGYHDGYHDGLNANKWLPCWLFVSEKLPEKNGRYLAYIVNKYDKSRYIVTCEYNADGYWKWYPDNGCIADNVVAWMHLPKLYNAESEE